MLKRFVKHIAFLKKPHADNCKNPKNKFSNTFFKNTFSCKHFGVFSVFDLEADSNSCCCSQLIVFINTRTRKTVHKQRVSPQIGGAINIIGSIWREII